jgi:hypothetical protein
MKRLPLFVGLVWVLGVATGQATTWNSDGSPANIQSIHDTQAQDGDTITMPAGTFNWTIGVSFSKRITLQGQTTVNTISGTANDQTTIRCSSSNGGAIYWQVPVDATGKICRVTGLTFVTGTPNAGFNGTGPEPSWSVR